MPQLNTLVTIKYSFKKRKYENTEMKGTKCSATGENETSQENIKNATDEEGYLVPIPKEDEYVDVAPTSTPIQIKNTNDGKVNKPKV